MVYVYTSALISSELSALIHGGLRDRQQRIVQPAKEQDCPIRSHRASESPRQPEEHHCRDQPGVENEQHPGDGTHVCEVQATAHDLSCDDADQERADIDQPEPDRIAEVTDSGKVGDIQKLQFPEPVECLTSRAGDGDDQEDRPQNVVTAYVPETGLGGVEAGWPGGALSSGRWAKAGLWHG